MPGKALKAKGQVWRTEAWGLPAEAEIEVRVCGIRRDGVILLRKLKALKMGRREKPVDWGEGE